MAKSSGSGGRGRGGGGAAGEARSLRAQMVSMSQRMSELRPIANVNMRKRYGLNGPTPAQAAVHRQAKNELNRLSRQYKQLVNRSNELFAAGVRS